MSQRIPNPLLERYHRTYTSFEHLNAEQIDTLCLCSYLMHCISQVRSTEYSGAIIPAVRTLEQSLRLNFRASRKRTRTIGAFVHYYSDRLEAYNALCDNVNYPDHLIDRVSFLKMLKNIAHHRGQAGHAYISRKAVARCLAWCAMLINVMNTMDTDNKMKVSDYPQPDTEEITMLLLGQKVVAEKEEVAYNN